MISKDAILEVEVVSIWTILTTKVRLKQFNEFSILNTQRKYLRNKT